MDLPESQETSMLLEEGGPSFALEPGARVLIHAMQSSGATLFALFVGQRPRSVVIPDLWITEQIPPLTARGDLILKTTASQIPFETHVNRFRPDRTIIFLRDPLDQISSLDSKSYRDLGGTLEQKLAVFDELFAARQGFDLCVEYERFTTAPDVTRNDLGSLGLNLPETAATFARSPEAIVEHARSSSEWANKNFRVRWGLGGAKTRPGQTLRPSPPKRIETAEQLAREYSPNLFAYYHSGTCE